jgi:hypothetical protein
MNLMQLKLNLYMSLTQRQRNMIGPYSSYRKLELIPMSDFLKITKNKQHINLLISIKRFSMRIAA